jgi:hypothetical protein
MRTHAVPGAVISLVGVALSELRRDLNQLLSSGWDERIRRRAEELASTLIDACEQHGLREISALVRALSSMTRISAATALPLLGGLRRKFRTLLVQADIHLAARTDRYVG